jgi:hypothetical protein
MVEGEYMKYDAGMVRWYTPTFIKISSGIQKLIGVYRNTQTKTERKII